MAASYLKHFATLAMIVAVTVFVCEWLRGNDSHYDLSFSGRLHNSSHAFYSKLTHSPPRFHDVSDVIFVFSIIATSRNFIPGQWDELNVIAWERRHYMKNMSLVCCFLYESKETFKRTIIGKQVKEKHHLFWGNEAGLISVQFVSDLERRLFNNSFQYPVSVSLSLQWPCPREVTTIPIVYVDNQHRKNGLAISGRFVFARKDARQLVEWIEFHRHFGASHILLYVSDDLNNRTRQVVDYYNRLGQLEVFYMPALPKLDEFPRNLSVRPHDVLYHDEHVTDFDVQARLSGYKYFITMDTDEYLAPVVPGVESYPQLLDYLLKKKPKAGSFKLKSEIYMTTWGMTNPGEDMYISRFRNRTIPFIDRTKNIHVTTRIEPGSVWVHQVDVKPGYTWEVADENDVVLKHFRSCRNEWLASQDAFQRIFDDYMSQIAIKIRPRVMHTVKTLGL